MTFHPPVEDLSLRGDVVERVVILGNALVTLSGHSDVVEPGSLVAGRFGQHNRQVESELGVVSWEESGGA